MLTLPKCPEKRHLRDLNLNFDIFKGAFLGQRSKFFFTEYSHHYVKVCEKKFLTFMGQMDQAQNAILKMAILS